MRLILLIVLLCSPIRAAEPFTVAEKSDFKATSRSNEVIDFCQTLAKQSKRVHFTNFGKSHEGRELPLLILSDSGITTLEEVRKSGKLVLLAFANIHAGEVDGKEAVLMLARDLALAPEAGVLKHLVILLAPNFNTDGNEKVNPKNRKENQVGPEDGVGIRFNSQGYDLNRDFIKLEAPETRALLRLIQETDPAIIVDMHTTNGSYHRYELTYDCPRHPGADPDLIATVRDQWMPKISDKLLQKKKFKSFFYGNFENDHERWESYECLPRYGIQYFALRNRVGILSESYSYAPFKTRVLASYGFLQSIIEFAADNPDEIKKRVAAASHLRDRIELQTKLVPLTGNRTILGYVEEKIDGKTRPTKQTKDYSIPCLQGVDSTRTIPRPFAYLLPAEFDAARETLQQHGIIVETLQAESRLEVEVSEVQSITKEKNLFQKHSLVTVTVSRSKQMQTLPVGTLVVRTEQPLGNLAGFLLEPEAEDGLTTWNFFDTGLKVKTPFPVVRLNGKTDLKLKARD